MISLRMALCFAHTLSAGRRNLRPVPVRRIIGAQSIKAGKIESQPDSGVNRGWLRHSDSRSLLLESLSGESVRQRAQLSENTSTPMLRLQICPSARVRSPMLFVQAEHISSTPEFVLRLFLQSFVLSWRHS